MIGIGGIGMSGIAQLLQRLGMQVSGSDLSKGDSCRALEALGIQVYLGHHAEHVRDAQVVVYSSAVSQANPEWIEAQRRKIPCIPRAEMLAELMRLKNGIAVAGAHGKTTTTSMVGWIVKEAGLDPTIVVGGRMDNFGGTNACLGTGEYMVVEADESDGSFNKLSPSIAIVTNMDREHLDHYGSFEELKKAFRRFLEKLPFYGVCIICADDEHISTLSEDLHRRRLTYGFKDSDYKILSYAPGLSGCTFQVQSPTGIVELRLSLVGRHNALNAVAALALADEIGIDREVSVGALATYRGVQRRFQFRGELKGIRFYDDYAHHPTEIKATLASAKERFPESGLRVLFQPHRYSRVQDLWKDFSQSFAGCDEVVVLPIYSAGESPIDGVTSELLAEEITKTGIPTRISSDPFEIIQGWVGATRKKPETVLTLGAGDLPKVYGKLF